MEGVGEAANLIKALLISDEEGEKAAQRIAHLAGMRAVEELWEDRQSHAEKLPTPHVGPLQQQKCQQPARRQPQGALMGASRQTQQQQHGNWVQRAAAAAALPQQDYMRVGCNGKPKKEPTVLERVKTSLPWDERAIVFERAAGAPLIAPAVAVEAAAHVNIALSKVAPPHVRTVIFKISPQCRLTTAA